MTETLTCHRCGVSILATTAARTGGVCVPCKRGTREGIEASKEWHRLERERDMTDPYRRLWRTLVDRVEHTTEGFGGLSAPEQSYFAVVLLEGEVYNGGFDQYFFNSSSAYFTEARRGLLELGAKRCVALLEGVKVAIFGKGDVPIDTAERRALLRDRHSPELARQLDELDQAFWQDEDGFATRLEDFARQHRLIASGPTRG
jgi:hypothetical protein